MKILNHESVSDLAGTGTRMVVANAMGDLSTQALPSGMTYTATTPLNITGTVISIPKATTSVDGYLAATDFTTFNNKTSYTTANARADTGFTDNGTVITTTNSRNVNLSAGKTISLAGSTSGTVTLGVPAAAGTTTFNLPGSNGTNGYGLITDGSGNTSWSAVQPAYSAFTAKQILYGNGTSTPVQDTNFSYLNFGGNALLTLGNGVTSVGIKFNYTSAGGGDFTGQLSGTDQLSFGFNNLSPYTSGRQIYFYDRVAGAYLGNFDTSGFYVNNKIQSTNVSGNYIQLSYDTTGTADYFIKRNVSTGYLSFTGNQTGFVGYTFDQGVGIAGKFQVDGNGNITKLNNVTTSFPSSNSAGVLTNNGSGTLTWSAAGGSAYTFSTGLTNTLGTVTDNLATGISGGQTAIGGTAVGDGLTLKGTTGNGTATAKAVTFTGGNNGATTLGFLQNNGITILGASATTDGAFKSDPTNKFFGIYDASNATYYGLSTSLPGSSGYAVLGGYYKGLGIAGTTNGGTNPIFGVLNSAQGGNGLGATSFTVLDNKQVYTYYNTLDDGTGKMGIGITPTSTLHVGGSVAVAYVPKSANYTLGASDHTVEVTTTGTTQTLPTAVGITGREYEIVLSSTGSCTVATTSSQTISGLTTYSLSAQYKYVKIRSNGANWLVVANN